jgi:hypothetical protein
MKHLSLIMLVFAMVFVVTVQKSSAQDVAVDAVPSEVAEEATPVETAALPETPTVSIPEQVNASTLPSYYEPSPVDLNEIPSLFFTKWEHDLLIEARLGATTRPVVDGEDPQDTEIFALPDDPAAIAGAPGEVELGGILYVSPSDWVIWLNGARVTPTAIPTVIMDIKVFKDHVDMEWLDRATNQIYPIRLRAHQKFNLQSRMFLPAGG